MIVRTLREWDYLPIAAQRDGQAITRADADRLIDAAAAVRIGGDDGARILDNGVRRLRAQQVVGIIAAEGVTLEILPKIEGDEGKGATRKKLVQMLAEVIDLDVAEGRLANLDWQREDLLEILIRLFIDRLFAAVHRGLPRNYICDEDDLSLLRGRLDIKRQFSTLAASPHRIACRFDELSADIPLNRIMKAAVHTLLRHARAPSNQRRLRELLLALADVGSVAVRELPWRDVVLDRTNRTWGELLTLAKLLLGERFQTTTGGGERGFALLFEMNRLFEEYVGRILRRRLAGSGWRVELQAPRKFALTDADSGVPRFLTIPDIVIHSGGRPALVIDTKWKRLPGLFEFGRYGVASADVYQMMAYSHVHQCERMLLLYPHHDGLPAEPGRLCEQIITGTEGKRIVVATVSLSEPASVGDQLTRLVWTLIGQPEPEEAALARL